MQLQMNQKSLRPIAKTTWPLIKLNGKFGYLGVLMQTKDRALVQCHECGELRAWLNNAHLHTHGLNAAEYKRLNGLAAHTPLMATVWANKRSSAAKASPKMYYRRAKLRTTDYVRKDSRRVSIEERNQFGTCGAQLAGRLVLYIKQHRKLPSSRSGSSGRQLYRSIQNHLGSLNRLFKLFFAVKYTTSGRMVTLKRGTTKIKYDTAHDNEKAYRWLVDNVPALSFSNKRLESYLSELALKEFQIQSNESH